jgi:hypothetical protein
MCEVKDHMNLIYGRKVYKILMLETMRDHLYLFNWNLSYEAVHRGQRYIAMILIFQFRVCSFFFFFFFCRNHSLFS